ncbi:MAG: RDD family protein [Myxococcota bacterium]
MADPWSAPDDRRAPPPGGPDADGRLADPGARFLAALVDTVVIYLPFVPAFAVAVGIGSEEGVPAEDPLFLATAIVGTVAALGVTVWQWSGIVGAGQTFGKRLLGIRIVRTSGAPVDFVYGVILRNWALGFVAGVFGVCNLGWVIRLADVVMVLRSDRRCLHDHLADTQVIDA